MSKATALKRVPRSRQLVSIDILRAEHRLDQIDDDSTEAAELRKRLADLYREYVGAKVA